MLFIPLAALVTLGAASPAKNALLHSAESGLEKRSNVGLTNCGYAYSFLTFVCLDRVPDAYSRQCMAAASAWYTQCCQRHPSNEPILIGEEATLEKRQSCLAGGSPSDTPCNSGCSHDVQQCYRAVTYGSIPDAQGGFGSCDGQYVTCCGY